MDSPPSRQSLLERLSGFLSREPEDREELLLQLRSACERNLIDVDALGIIEGAVKMSDLQAHDVMVPRAQMDVIRLSDPIDRIVQFVVETAHSRFPAVGEGKDDIVGVFLAKDLLRYFSGRKFVLSECLRPAVFVPESMRLNVLLREFRISHNHMAIVVDEYGGVAGLVTIEDVLEQVVGEIEDEFDSDDAADNIRVDAQGRYRVKARTEIDDFNAAFGTAFSDDDVDTVGGLLIRRLGRLPRRGEFHDVEGVRFKVLRADRRRIYTLLVERLRAPDDEAA